jgi:hypothetical protein
MAVALYSPEISEMDFRDKLRACKSVTWGGPLRDKMRDENGPARLPCA